MPPPVLMSTPSQRRRHAGSGPGSRRSRRCQRRRAARGPADATRTPPAARTKPGSAFTPMAGVFMSMRQHRRQRRRSASVGGGAPARRTSIRLPAKASIGDLVGFLHPLGEDRLRLLDRRVLHRHQAPVRRLRDLVVDEGCRRSRSRPPPRAYWHRRCARPAPNRRRRGTSGTARSSHRASRPRARSCRPPRRRGGSPTTSAWAVGSFVEVTWFQPSASTWPSRTITAPNGPPGAVLHVLPGQRDGAREMAAIFGG